MVVQCANRAKWVPELRRNNRSQPTDLENLEQTRLTGKELDGNAAVAVIRAPADGPTAPYSSTVRCQGCRDTSPLLVAGGSYVAFMRSTDEIRDVLVTLKRGFPVVSDDHGVKEHYDHPS